MNSIVKALTIQLSVDDLTGGAWSTAAKEIKSVWNNVTALNSAWDLGEKIYNKTAEALRKPVEMLSAGSEYAEAKAGFESLASTYSVDGKRIVDSIRDITEGNIGLQAATQAASYAIMKGYSAEETETIWRFAKRYTDTMGGDVVEVAGKIEKAILYHQEKIFKQFDLGITKTDDIRTAIGKVKDKFEEMNEPAFNFGDAWKGMGQSIQDALLAVEAEMNNLVGGTDFESFAESFRESMREIEDDASGIAEMIWRPFADMAEIANYTIENVSGFAYEKTDGFKVYLETWIIGIASTLYDLGIKLSSLSYIISRSQADMDNIEYFAEEKAKYENGLLAGKTGDQIKREARDKYMDEWIADSEREWQERLDDANKIESANATSALKEQREKARAEKAELKAERDAKRAEEKEYNRMQKEANSEWNERIKEEKKAAEESVKATQAKVKSYETIGESMKSLGDIMSKEQEGINKTTGSLADLYTGNFDSFRDTEKKRGLEDLLSRQEREKAKERDILEKQADAQRKLAEALTEYTKNPKIVEFRAPNNPNILETFIQYLINFLHEEARAEGNMVQA